MNITITHLSKNYGKKEILKDINYTFLGPNKYYIIGENGVGKTSLFKAILKQVSYTGTIEVNGRISYQPEEVVFPPYMHVMSFIKTFATLTEENNKINQEIIVYLKKFGMEKLKDAWLGSLSKGQKQKVNIIQALLTPSEILIMDEPFSGLDQGSKAYLKKVLDKEKRLIIVVSHLRDEPALYGYKIIELKTGEMREIS